MSTIGQALGVESYALEHGGKTYRASLLIQEAKAKFEDTLTGRALRMLATMRGIYSPEEYQDERVALIDEIKTGAFSFHGELASAALKSPAGILSLTAILFGIPEGEAISLMVEREPDVRTILDAVLAASLPAAKPKAGGEEDAEKKATAPRTSFTSRL